MKIYKKIVNFGWGLMILLPFLWLAFSYIGFIKNYGFLNNSPAYYGFDGVLSSFVGSFYLNQGVLDLFYYGTMWRRINLFVQNNFLGGFDPDMYPFLWAPVFYAEWVLIVSLLKLLFSFFGVIFNIGQRWLDRLGGAN